MGEQWKAIPGYEEYYDISDQGRVRAWRDSHARKLVAPRIRKLRSIPSGHLHIVLSKHDQVQTFKVHQLVLLAFCGPRPKNKETSHLDGNPKNNKLSNLVYESHLKNMRRAIQPDRRGERCGRHKISLADVHKIRQMKKAGKLQREIAELFPITRAQIGYICRNKSWINL